MNKKNRIVTFNLKGEKVIAEIDEKLEIVSSVLKNNSSITREDIPKKLKEGSFCAAKDFEKVAFYKEAAIYLKQSNAFRMKCINMLEDLLHAQAEIDRVSKHFSIFGYTISIVKQLHANRIAKECLDKHTDKDEDNKTSAPTEE